MKNVQDIYPVSPMQEAMLLHSQAHTRDDTLFNQFCYYLDADLDQTAFQRAWEQVVARHAALRTAFVWAGVKTPQQVVRQTVKPEFVIEDWRARDPDQQRQDLVDLQSRDRASGFDLKRAPLMRFHLLRLADHRWFFMWSNHHLILDRWCLGTVYSDLNRFYKGLCAGDKMNDAPAPSFRNYIDWIRQQDRTLAHRFWRNTLAGFKIPSFLLPCLEQRSPPGQSQQKFGLLTVDGEIFDALKKYAGLHGLTMGVLIQGAWGLALNQHTGRQDVIFGAAVSGRPPDLPQVDSIVGSFINNIPVRLRMLSQSTMVTYFRELQAAQFHRHAFEYLSPADIRLCAQFSDGASANSLYDCLFVWLTGGHDMHTTDLPLQPVSVRYATSYPLTLSVEDNGSGLDVRLDAAVATDANVQPALDSLHSILQAVAASDGRLVLGELPGFVNDVEFDGGNVRQETEQSMGNVAAATTTVDGPMPSGREGLHIDMMRDMLCSAWHEVLEYEKIADDSDFFGLGGTSIQAALLHTKIESATRKSIPLLALFGDPTITGMARMITAEDWPLQPHVVTALRASGKPAPLFCVASPEVNTLGYSLMTRYLDRALDVYVVQAPPVTDTLSQLHPSELATTASHYLEAIRTVQPAGPYRILTMCAGSHISVEIARQLEADGLAVDFFGVINTWSLYSISRWFYVNRFINIARYYRQRLAGILTKEDTKPDTGHGHVAPVPAASHSAQMVPAEEQAGLDNPWISEVGFAHKDPKNKKMTTPVTVFRLKNQQYWRVRDQSLGWSRLSANVNIVPMAGHDHDAMMREPRVQDLANAVSNSLRALAQNTGTEICTARK
ncbi:MAG: hypothetical protein HKN70_11315 [Gammaproteobacteria bacterium]|nr:hypothetical protein [Gammaproteobacteria bacterium]